jgi:hypothetical protein
VGYFAADGSNDSMKFSADNPFGNDQGMSTQIIHEVSNSYVFPYADANPKTLLAAAIDSPITSPS